MEWNLSSIADVLGILSFFISIFVAAKVYNINVKVGGNVNKQSAFGKKNKQEIKN